MEHGTFLVEKWPQILRIGVCITTAARNKVRKFLKSHKLSEYETNMVFCYQNCSDLL